MGFFEKQKSFGRRCGGTVAMRPWSYEFCCVRILASSLEAFPTEFSKTLFGIFTPKTCSKTSANLFTHPMTRSRSLRPLKQKFHFRQCCCKLAAFLAEFPKTVFFIFLTLRHALKPWLICLFIQRQLCVLQEKIKIASFPKVPGLISRTVNI